MLLVNTLDSHSDDYDLVLAEMYQLSITCAKYPTFIEGMHIMLQLVTSCVEFC